MADTVRALAGRIAAHTRWAKTTDRTAATEPARRAAEQRFYEQARQLHPDATDEQITEVAKSLRAAHYARLAALSAKARRKPRITPDEHLARAAAARAALAAQRAGG